MDFKVLEKAPKSYVGYVNDKGIKIGDAPFWVDSPIYSDIWDEIVNDTYRLPMEQSYVKMPVLYRGLLSSYDREKQKAAQEKKIHKNQFTGEEGWWITTREGKRIFISAERARKQRESGLLDYAAGTAKALGLALTAAVGVHGTFVALNTGMIWAGSEHALSLRRGAQVIWENRKAVADQISMPFTASMRSGMGVIPASINPLGVRGRNMVYFGYGLVSKSGENLGSAGFGINMKEKFIVPGITFRSQKGHHQAKLQALFRDSYERARKLGLKEYRITTAEDGGYAWARTGFEFNDASEREKVVRRAKRWLQQPTVTETPKEAAKSNVLKDLAKKGKKKPRGDKVFPLWPKTTSAPPKSKKAIDLTPGQVAEIESMVANAKTAKDFSELSYRHPVYGKIRLGKEWMTGLEWDGYVDISTDNPGHRIMRTWLYRGGTE